jgi:hypothetical protein
MDKAGNGRLIRRFGVGVEWQEHDTLWRERQSIFARVHAAESLVPRMKSRLKL